MVNYPQIFRHGIYSFRNYENPQTPCRFEHKKRQQARITLSGLLRTAVRRLRECYSFTMKITS